MIKLNIYVVYSEELENRHTTINSSISLIKDICTQKNIEVKINVISEPGKEHINKYITNFNTRVNYDKFAGNNIYNELITPLNVCQISNFEKHRYIYKLILDNSKESEVGAANELHLIIEDDVIVLKDYIANISEFIEDLDQSANAADAANAAESWDILFTCLNVVNNPAKYININDLYNIIISKSCYVIKNREMCAKLYEATNTFKLNIKLTLSKFIKDNNYKAISYNKITFIEGSKLGLYPTSVNPNNYLFLNNNYIALKQLSEKKDLNEDDIKKAEQIFSESQNIQSIDIQNMMGIIYFNYKNYKKAKEYMTTSLSNLKKCKGYSIMKNNEILSNTINIYKYDQDLLDECIVAKSKYS